MKNCIFVLVLTICINTNIGIFFTSAGNNTAIDQMMKNVCEIAKKTLKIQNAGVKDKETIINYMREKLSKKSLELDLDSGAPVKLILQGMSMLADDRYYNEVCLKASHKVRRRSTKYNSTIDQIDHQYVPDTRSLVDNVLADEGRVKSVVKKIETIVENVMKMNNASTAKLKRRDVDNLKHIILDTFTRELMKKEKNINKTNEYRDIIANAIDMTVNGILNNETRRMSIDFLEDAGRQIEEESNLIAQEALAEVITEAAKIVSTSTTAASQPIVGLTKDYGDGEGCEDVVQRTCAELKNLDSHKCEYDGMTISTPQVCDGVIDCPDGSDEKNCIRQVIAKVHSATQVMSKVELSRHCFKSLYESTIISRQGELLSELLNSQIEFLKKYVLKGGKAVFPEIMMSSTPMSHTGELQAKNIYHHESNVDSVVAEVALVLRTFVTSLNSALCLHRNEDVMRVIDDVADPSEVVEQEFDTMLEEAHWSPSSYECAGQYCANKTCPPLSKRFCYQMYTLNRFPCKSLIKNDNSIPIDAICDGKLDCYDENDEINCADGVDNNLAKFDGNKIYNKVINMIKNKIYSKGYDLVRGPMIELQVHVQNIQKRSLSPKVNNEAFKSLRHTYFKIVKSIFLEMMDNLENMKNGEEVYEFFLTLNERMVEALKYTHTGNSKVILADDCFCRGSECAQVKCSARCVRNCNAKAALTNYACSVSATGVNMTVPVDAMCNRKINCPNGDDELNCRPEICRVHHARVLRHNIQAVGGKYKGSIVGHALDTWKDKVSSILIVLEKRERLTPRTFKNTVNKILHDLSLTYMTLGSYRRLDTGKILKKFVKLSQHLIESLKSCNK